MDEFSTIGERLRTLRRWRGMTLAALGGLAGVTPQYLSAVELGKKPLDRRSTISALAEALRVSETDLTGGPHLGKDPLQSGPHAAVPALRVALSVNTTDAPIAENARPLGDVVADLKDLSAAHAAGDFLRLGPVLPNALSDLYFHVANPANDDARIEAARALVDVLHWSADMCHVLRYPDLAQIAARAAIDAATLIEDHVRIGMAQFERIGTAPHPSAASWVQARTVSERAANALEPHAHDAVGFQVLGMLTLRCALAAAATQDSAATKHWLAEAQTLASRVNDDDPAANWEWFGATNVAIWRTALAVESGEGGELILKLAGRVNPGKLVVATRRAGLYLDVARGLARDARTQDDAAKWLARAEQASPQLFRNYGPARETVAFLLSRARSAAGGRELRGMAARMGVPH
jgi:transcriptional regulator with XRE-family HTH domain